MNLNFEESICVIVVTYNRRALLEQCLEGIHSQSKVPDQIIVINNGSTDGTGAWLATQTDLITIYQENQGGAGGFGSGIRTAYERGYDWIWCMDDDGIPAQDCLEILLKTGRQGFHYIAPNLVGENSKSHFERRFKTARTRVVGFCGGPFNGILLSRNLVNAVGYPIKEFFIWGDEVEYCNRIVESGFPVVTCQDAIHYHKSTAINFRTSKRGFYLARNKVYTYRLFQGIYRSKTVYLMGILLETTRFIISCLQVLNWNEVIAAINGFVQGWHDPLGLMKDDACWWGINTKEHLKPT